MLGGLGIGVLNIGVVVSSSYGDGLGWEFGEAGVGILNIGKGVRGSYKGLGGDMG